VRQVVQLPRIIAWCHSQQNVKKCWKFG